jgi:DNA-binding IclR family transcriptional regulator
VQNINMQQRPTLDTETKDTPSYSAPALEKGLDILELLHESETALTQKEISFRLGRSVSELYRMLNILVRRNYVANYDDKFAPTTKLFRISQAYPPVRRLLAAAIPIMEELSRQVGFGCDLRVYNSGSQTVLSAVDAPGGLGFSVRTGSEIAVAPSASGRVLVAFQDSDTMELRLRESFPGRPDSEIKAFRKDVHEVIIKGYAALQSKQYAGLYAISFPVLDVNDYAVAALTVPMLPRIDDPRQATREDVIAALRGASTRLSQSIS